LHPPDFEFKHQPLKIGRTCGNRFRLVLRDIVTDERTTNAVVAAVRERGFVNYYGAPRAH
jgi:tRNA(Glu) U13 pseudouridine synthase TruD